MLRAHDYSADGRARKEAAALADAGAKVTMVGIGTHVPDDLVAAGRDVRLLAPTPSLGQPRLGREAVWWPIRVGVNLTYMRARERRHANRLAFLRVYEDVLSDAIEALEPDVVHAHNIQMLPSAVRVKRRTGAHIIYDNRDLYWDAEYVNESTRKQIAKIEARIIGSVDATITVCEPRADILEARYGISRPVVVYNGPSKVMSAPCSVHDPVRLFFQGAFSHSRNLETLIEAMGDLRGRATLTLQGFRGNELDLRQLVVSLGLEETVTFIPPVGPLEVVDSASVYDVGVICHKGDTPNLRSTVPNKLMDYLGAGLALAVSDLPGHRSVLDDTGAAVFIDPSTARTVAEGIGRLLDEPHSVTTMKRAALETARRYEWPIQARTLIRVYQSVLGRYRS